jgi:hypothetical protein
MISLADFESRIAGLDRRLRPIADRPVDITVPGWGEHIVSAPLPPDQAGVRAEMESLLRELIAAYQKTSEDVRMTLRKFFADYRAFSWAASLHSNPRTAEGLRDQLLLFSLKDQGRDSRDALLELQHLCGEARLSGLDAAPIFQEVAVLSSEVNKFKMGSTKEMLLNAC